MPPSERPQAASAYPLAGAPSQEQLERVLQASEDAIVVVGSDQQIRYVNDAALTLFGRERDELIGHPFGYTVATGKPSRIDILRPDGREQVAEMRTSALVWEDDTDARLAVIRDVTGTMTDEITNLSLHVRGLSLRIAELETRLAEVERRLDGD